MSTYNVEASFAYSLTLPGEVPYSSQQFRSALTISEEVTANNLVEAQELGEGRLAALAQGVKLHAINEAGLSAATDANGVVIPVFGSSSEVSNVRAIETAPSAQVVESETFDQPSDQSVASNGSATPMWDGRPIKIWDNRLSKKTEKSPDFRIQFLDAPEGASDDDKFKPFWLQNKDNTPNSAALKVKAMAEASQS